MGSGSRRWIVAVIIVTILLGVAALGFWRGEDGPPAPGVSTASAPVASPPQAPRFRPLRPRDLHGAQQEEDPGDPFGSIAGVVTNWSTGQPVRDAEVTFLGPRGAASVPTDGEGRFLFRAMSPDALALGMVTAAGFLPYAPELGLSPLRFMPRAGARVTGVRIQLRPVLAYRGRVVTVRDEPVAGASVVLLGATSGEQALVGLAATFEADARGEFTFSAPDGAWLEARHPNHGVGRGQMDELAQSDHRLTITLTPATLAADAMIAGVVLGPDGQPREGTPVAARSDGSLPTSLGVSDEAGRFELGELVPGAYDVVAQDPGHVLAVAPQVRTGTRQVELRLRAGSAVQGHLRTTEGAPVVSATVLAVVHEGPLRRTPAKEVTVFDAAGFYRIEGLEPGTYTLVAVAHGRARARVEDVALGEGMVEVDLHLPAGATIRGRVTDEASGQPLPLARVTLETGFGGGPSVAPMLSTAVTASDGRYEIGGVEAGRHSVEAVAFGHDARSASGVEVEDGATVNDVDLALAGSAPEGGARFDIVGIGAALGVDDEHLQIQKVVAGAGAERAGLRAGDRILAVDGTAIVDLGFEGAIQAIRGQEGTTVVLTLRRGKAAPVDARVTRSRVKG